MQKTLNKEKDKTRLRVFKDVIGNIVPISKKKGNLNPNAFFLFFKDYFPYFSRDLTGNSSNSSVEYLPKNVFQNQKVEDFLAFESKGYAALKQEISNIMGIAKFKAQVNTGGVDFFVFLDQPNWELEEKIYSIFGKILDKYPEEQVDLRIIDLCKK